MRLTIVVAVLDEEREIAQTLAPLQPLRAVGHEIIVVDGGSVDATRAIAAPLADRVIVAPRGRAAQMNAGAIAATSEILLFLHADSRLAPDAVDAMIAQLRTSSRRWGRFDVAIDGRSAWLPLVALAMNLRSRLTGIATGDQAMFVERALLDAVGDIPLQPLMEDVELSRRLKRAAGRPLCVRGPVRTSGRRWDANGAWRTIVTMWRLRLAYWRGASAADLAQRYAAMGSRVSAQRAPTTLQIFAKAPAAGTVKTRLAVTEGAERASTIHRELIECTLATACSARTAGVVGAIELWCAPDANAPDFVAWRDRHAIELKSQRDGDLGARMHDALAGALSRGERPILVGCDCPALDVDYLRAAAAALDDCDAVFGPAEDGGYVLVGLARDADVFTGVPWGTNRVMATTCAALSATGTRWSQLPALWDVDRAEDLARWSAMRTSSEADSRVSSDNALLRSPRAPMTSRR